MRGCAKFPEEEWLLQELERQGTIQGRSGRKGRSPWVELPDFWLEGRLTGEEGEEASSAEPGSLEAGNRDQSLWILCTRRTQRLVS